MEAATSVSMNSSNVIWKWTAQRILIVITMMMLNFLIYVCYSMIAPFYPPLAAQKNLSQIWVGTVFAFYQIMMFLSSLFWGDKVSRYGPVFTLQVGVISVGISVSAFASLGYVSPNWLFVSLSFLLRGIEGFGCGMITVGWYTIITQEFSDRIGQVSGWLEGFATTGFLVGPVFGGLMHDMVGFWLPFVVFGVMLIASAVACALLFRGYQDIKLAPDQQPNENTALLAEHRSTDQSSVTVVSSDISVVSILKTPVVWVVGLCLVFTSGCLGLIDVGLANHLIGLNQATNSTMISDFGKNACFFIGPIAYGLSLVILGKCIDSFKTYRLFYFIGLTLCVIGCIFLGPTPWLVQYVPIFQNPHNALISTIVSLAVLGIGFAFASAPFVPLMILFATNKGFPDCTATSGAASGCVSVFYCLGMVIGPSLASVLCDYFSFAFAGGVFACVLLATLIFFAIFSTVYRRWFKSSRQAAEAPFAAINHSVAAVS